MKKKIGAFGARQFSLETFVGGRPGTTIFQNPGGGEGAGGGLVGVAYKDRARPPPRVPTVRFKSLLYPSSVAKIGLQSGFVKIFHFFPRGNFSHVG